MTTDWTFPYSSQRMPVLARNTVATSQPLAAQAGLRMLLAGGNAVDAALAAAITLTVVEPTSNGIGSDAFAILWDGNQLHGLNASGRSPAAWNPDHFSRHTTMPKYGWDAVTVPGAVSAWVEMSRRFGRLPFPRLFEPAIQYAAEGFPVSPITAAAWAEAGQTFAEYPDFVAAFLRDGRSPRAGELFTHPNQATTLTRIAETDGEAFYRGDLAEKIVAHARATGGTMTEEDLADHRPDWVGTVSGDYRDLTLHEIPPNGQGLAAIMMLGIVQHANHSDCAPDSADSLHLQIEAMKLAFADADRYIADPAAMDIAPVDLLSPAYLADRSRLIDRARARFPSFGMPSPGGTVLVTAADSDGMMISFIQSNFWGFGSGIVIPGTGIAMQNRGHGFTLQEGLSNQVGPRKRPFHTIIPGFLTQDGQPHTAFGLMGGQIQPQGHAQMVLRMRDFAQNPQTALDAPRWRIMPGDSVIVEPGFHPDVLNDLIQRGHKIETADYTNFGGGQIITRLPDSGYIAASDKRKDGQAVGY